MTIFRPCIDLYQGQVVQIVGDSFTNGGAGPVKNYGSTQKASWFADLYRNDGVKGGHVIQLGPGSKEQAISALRAFPGGLQVGGGITPDNAKEFLDAGASHVIVTSWIFPGNTLDWERLSQFKDAVGKDRLVIDLSCVRRGNHWYVAKNKWRTVTRVALTSDLIHNLQAYCDEFLIHAIDVEGKQSGIDADLVRYLGQIVDIPTTYAGGARYLEDLEEVKHLSAGKVDLTIGSALDIFGGRYVAYKDCVSFNKQQK